MSNVRQKLIAVTGPTGAGKSTFINLVCGSNFKVHAGLRSCTEKVQAAYCTIGGERFTLIDTPGFDDTEKSQADILKDIADFLEKTYEKGIKLTGLIYMHRISDIRMGGIARENFRLFTKICGDHAMRNVLIVTTMWDEVSQEVGAKREEELVSKSLFFKDAVDNGARMMRHLNNTASAKAVVGPFLVFSPRALSMQRELVDDHIVLPDTAAGTLLQTELTKQTDEYQKQLADLRDELQNLRRRWEMRPKEEIADLEKKNTQLQQDLKRAKDDMQKLQEEYGREPIKRRGGRRLMAKIFEVVMGIVGEVVIERSRQGGGCLDDNGFVL